MSLIQLKFLPIKIGDRVQKSLAVWLFMVLLIFSGTRCYATKVKVGDSYGGGTVFCVSETANTSKCVIEGAGEYGLIMANEDQSNLGSNHDHGVHWATTDGLVLGARSVDDGASNTAAIIKKFPFPQDNPANNAAWACNKYRDLIEGHTDWYLPAKNELNKMYLFAKANNLIGENCSGSKFNGAIQCLVGGYKEEFKIYWSSTEEPSSYYHDAWYQSFSSGYQYYCNDVPNYCLGVRAIRAFNSSTSQSLNSVETNFFSNFIREIPDLKNSSNSSIDLWLQEEEENLKRMIDGSQEESRQPSFLGRKEL